MMRTGVVCSLLALALSSTGVARISAQTPAPAAATPESAAAFLGDWTLTANGDNGPATFALAVKTEAGKVVAEISSEIQPLTKVTDVTMSGSSLLLRYGFDYQGMAVPVALTLKADGEATAAIIDFADGAYRMTGTAVKKK
jgi:hypothetical protein